MKFNTKEKAKILLDNSCKVHAIVTTNMSKYKGKTYLLVEANWRARVYVDLDRSVKYPYAYYYWDAIKLTNASEKKFKNLKKNTKYQHDFFGKEINPNNLLFHDGSLYNVEFCTANFLYLTDYVTDFTAGQVPYRNFDVLTGYCDSIYPSSKKRYWRGATKDSYRFVLIDNPLDILRIVDENR